MIKRFSQYNKINEDVQSEKFGIYYFIMSEDGKYIFSEDDGVIKKGDDGVISFSDISMQSLLSYGYFNEYDAKWNLKEWIENLNNPDRLSSDWEQKYNNFRDNRPKIIEFNIGLTKTKEYHSL